MTKRKIIKCTDMGKLNLYGDVFTKTSGTHGSDIASQRMDELDRMSLKQACQELEVNVLDIGCGLGAQSVRFALLGAKVTAVDIVDSRHTISDHLALLGMKTDAVDFRKTDICSFMDRCDKTYNVIYSQRFIHYLSYKEAFRLAEKLYQHTEKGGQVFISASGMSSELSNGYDAGKTIEERFSKLEPQMAQKHGILEPVCLYYKEELQELFAKVGYTPVSIWTSSFGNVKAVFKK